MKRYLAAVLGIAGSLALAAGAAAQAKKCVLQPYGELDVRDDGGQFVIAGAVNDAPARFVVDTGSPASMLFAPAVAKLGLKSTIMPNVTFYGVGGREEAYTTWIQTLRVAGLAMHGATLFVSRGGVGDATGLLGAPFLLQTDVEFDLPHGKLRFFKASNCTGDQVVYWGMAYSSAPLINAVDDSPAVMVKLNGAPIEAVLDTGSSQSVVTPDAAKRFGRVTESVAAGAIQGVTPHSSVALSLASFDQFSFGDETIGHARLGVADLFSKDTDVPLGTHLARAAVPQPQMLLGADFFRSHRVYVSRDQRRVYVSYLGGPVFAPAASEPAAK